MEPLADPQTPRDQMDTEVPPTSESENCSSTATLLTASPTQERLIDVLLTDEDLCIQFH